MSEAERAARANQPHALRLDMARALIPGLTFEEEGEGIIVADPARFGDVVLARKDTPTSYHLCVTHDDALQAVSLVTRGEDLQQATHLHRLLQALMGWPTPVYAHHQLLTDAAGRRLAKRDKAVTLRELRAAGVRADEIRDRLLAGSAMASVTWMANLTR
jgi:glutamyl-Q tRNA(Asp) synthetase